MNGTECGLKRKVEQTGGACMDKARELASSVMDQAQDAASSIVHTIGDVEAAAAKKAQDATTALGSGMKSLAGSIRENLPREGVLGTTSSSVAESLESGGRYLQQEGLGGMAKDVSDLIRRNPIQAILVGVGVGFLLARITTRGSSHGN